MRVLIAPDGSTRGPAGLHLPGQEEDHATDREQRKQLFNRITAHLLDNAVAIPLYTDRNSVAADATVPSGCLYHPGSS